MNHAPITQRFIKYSEEDMRADALWDRYRSRAPYETHGGAHLHEQPPHVQRMVYDFARLLLLSSKGISAKVEDLPYSGWR